MSACESVDLPDPFGPIERVHFAGAHLEVDAAQDLVARDGGVQIGDAQHVVGRSRQHHRDVVAVDLDRRTPAPAASRAASAARRWSSENVEPCFGHSISQLVLPHVALGEREVGVRAPVAERVEVVADAHDARCGGRRRRSGRPCPARCRSVAQSRTSVSHHRLARECSSLSTTERRSPRVSAPTGSRSNTSSKNPSTISRSASSGGMPRDSR